MAMAINIMRKTSIHEELKVLEEANYQSLDEKRITITAWLTNKLDEIQQEKIHYYMCPTRKGKKKCNCKDVEKWWTDKIAELQEQIDEMKMQPDFNTATAADKYHTAKLMRWLDNPKVRNALWDEATNKNIVEKARQDQEKLENRECKCDEKPGWDRSVCNFHKNKHIETEV